jgi:UDP:flavonoid glycosyltransferase YjiC (YdhE family)
VGDPDLRSRAEGLGAAIRSADGTERAADLIEAAARDGSAR